MTTEYPIFSIVIPTYNRKELLMETLETVFSQTYSNYEVIVVDNCSTDNTEALVAPLISAGRIKYIRHEKNFERSKSRNTGIINAKGTFITFLDSDDFMYPDCLMDALSFINKNPTILFFHNLYELVDNQKKLIYSYHFPSLRNQFKALSEGNFISCIGGFMHRQLYENIRFNENPKMIGSEDYEVWFYVLAQCKMGRIEKVNSGIREHLGRSVNNGAYDNLEFQKNYLLKKIKEQDLLFEKFGPYMNRLEASFILQQVLVTNQLESKGKSICLILKAIRKFPYLICRRRFYQVLYNTLKA